MTAVLSDSCTKLLRGHQNMRSMRSQKSHYLSYFAKSFKPFIICHPSFVICHLSSIICHPSSLIRHLTSVIHHLSSVICHLTSVNRHLSSVIRHLSFVIRLTIYLFSAHLCSILSELDSEDLHLVSSCNCCSCD